MSTEVRSMTSHRPPRLAEIGAVSRPLPQAEAVHAQSLRPGRWLAAAVLATAGLIPAWAQKAAMPGVTDTEIRIGNTAPYSGPGSAYSTIAKVEAAYF